MIVFQRIRHKHGPGEVPELCLVGYIFISSKRFGVVFVGTQAINPLASQLGVIYPKWYKGDHLCGWMDLTELSEILA